MSYYRWSFKIYKGELSRAKVEKVERTDNYIAFNDGTVLKNGQIKVIYPEEIFLYTKIDVDEYNVRREFALTVDRMMLDKLEEVKKIQKQVRMMRERYYDLIEGE